MLFCSRNHAGRGIPGGCLEFRFRGGGRQVQVNWPRIDCALSGDNFRQLRTKNVACGLSAREAAGMTGEGMEG